MLRALVMVVGLAASDLVDAGSASTHEAPPATIPGSGVVMTIADVEWVLLRMEIDGTSIEPRAGSRITLRAPLEGGVSGTASVNHYRGGLAASADGSLRWAKLGSTMMAGPIELMEQERAFLAALIRTSRWRLEGGILLLESADTAVRLVFHQ